LVLEKSLAGPIGLYVKFSTLQEYGVDRIFFLENDNVDSSQKNVIFIARGEKAPQIIAITGKYSRQSHVFLQFVAHIGPKSRLLRGEPTLHSQS
jgi:hypothetical protein